MENCKLCGIVLSGIEYFNTESPVKGRCLDCEHIEERIKNKCACGNKIYNSVAYYKQNGNMCRSCLAVVNRKLMEKKL